MIEAFIGLVGVVIGFVLSVAYGENKERKNTSVIKDALRAELRSNLHILPMKRHILKQAQDGLKRNAVLSRECVRFSRIIYDEHSATVSPFLTHKERNSLHVIYEYFRIIDQTLADFPRSLAGSTVESTGNLAALFSAMFSDFDSLFKRLEELIEKHLAGNPEDVFHLSIEYSQLKDAKFRMP